MATNLELRWLRAFLAVAEENHVTRAARRLNVAQPALSAQLRQLEEAVGVRLFERTNRVSGLTAAGRALLPEAQAIVERTERARDVARRADRGEGGTLRVGIIPPAATGAVARALRDFSRARLLVEVQVEQAGQQRLETRLAEGGLDVVLGRPPTRGGARPGHRFLFAEEQGILLPADDPRAAAAHVRWADLAGASLLLLRGNAHFGGNLLASAARRGVDLRPRPAADDFPSLHWMVRAGLGVAPGSLALADALPEGVVVRPLRPAPPRLTVHALWRGREPSGAVRAWLDELARSLPATAGIREAAPAVTPPTA